MKKTVAAFLLTTTLSIFSQPILAMVDLFKYTQTLHADQADPSSRSTILGIIGSCGTVSTLNDDCVIEGLSRVGREENNAFASAIVLDYQNALGQGRTNTLPECQTETHMQANRIIGHCMLLMNYYALNDMDRESAVKQYEMCLQGGMLGLVYQGNIVAQYLIGSIYSRKGLTEPADVWKRALNLRKDTEEYQLLMHCYH